MHYLVIDPRFGTPIYVFLEIDPRGNDEYPGLDVREITLDSSQPPGSRRQRAIGRDPHHLDVFREFGSDGSATVAGYILIEPRYVGPSWESYAREFRPQGDKPTKAGGRTALKQKV
jgi:hypothetical protein